jgi:hypothetical protein
MTFFCSPVGLPDVSHAGLELVFGGTGALLFYHCNVVWRSFRLGIQGVEVSILLGAFFL